MSKKHKSPIKTVCVSGTLDFVGDKYISSVFLWNAYQRDILNDDQYEAGLVLLADGWDNTPQQLIEAARKL